MRSTFIADLKRALGMGPQPLPPLDRPIRVVVAGHDLKFMRPIMEYIGESERYELRVDEHRGHHLESESRARECVAWADVVWCEWALGNLVWYSKHKKRGQLLLARLHLQEWRDRARIPFIYGVKWKSVDRLFFIAHHIQDGMHGEFPLLRGAKSRLLHCPIDARGKLNVSKPNDARRTLGMVGIVPKRKRLDLAIAVLQGLLDAGEEYHLHIKGKMPGDYDWMKSRAEEMAWYEEIFAKLRSEPIGDHVHFDGFGENMHEWYQKIGYLLSPSDFEGCHLSVAESMATGAIPVIRNWEGANRIYPPQFVWESVSEAVSMVLHYADASHWEYGSRIARAVAQDDWDQRDVWAAADSEIVVGRTLAGYRDYPAEAIRKAEAMCPTVLVLGYLAPGYESGYRVRIEEEIRNLMRWGCRVHFACLHPKAGRGALRAHRKSLEELGAAVHLIRSHVFFQPGLDEAAAADELDALARICSDHGIALVHAEALYSARLALMLKARCNGLRLVFDAHGVTPEEEVMGGAAPARVDAMTDWETRVLRGADLNVFVSSAMAEHYRVKYGFQGENYLVTPCCVSESRFAKGDAPLDLPEGKTVLAYAGSLSAWQCGEEMLALLAALCRRDARYHVLLLVPRGDREKLSDLMTKHGLPEACVTVRSLPHGEVPAALAQAHAGLLPRKPDPVNRVASPTKFAEYLAAGLPVIMTQEIGDFSAFAADRGVGLVLDYGDIASCAPGEAVLERIDAFMADCAREREHMARKSRLLAREHFHWDTHAKTLMRAYTECLGE